jgi:hypothetical protein
VTSDCGHANLCISFHLIFLSLFQHRFVKAVKKMGVGPFIVIIKELKAHVFNAK